MFVISLYENDVVLIIICQIEFFHLNKFNKTLSCIQLLPRMKFILSFLH
jgi:hypothetical protein